MSSNKSTNQGILKSSFANLKVLDVYGVSNNGGTRHCSAHETCGDSVVVSDKLYCVWGVQPSLDNPNKTEEVVKVYKINEDGFARCHVGYIPRRYFHKFNPLWFDETYLRVKEDLRHSDNDQEVTRSVKNCGILVCDVIRNDLRYNSYNPLEEPCEVSSIDSETMVPPNLKKRIIDVANAAKANSNEENENSSTEDEETTPKKKRQSKKCNKKQVNKKKGNDNDSTEDEEDIPKKKNNNRRKPIVSAARLKIPNNVSVFNRIDTNGNSVNNADNNEA